MGGIEPARTYILQALKSGKHVVTANKAVVAKYLQEFIECAKENHVKFYFEDVYKRQNLRSHFAEFLGNSSLAHLRILSLPTCVGFRCV